MQTLKLDDNTARKLYPKAIPEFKTILEQSWPAGFFTQKITERVKTFDDILAISGRTMASLINPDDRPDDIARKQIELIAEVYNEGDQLDPLNTKQIKYYPWFEITPGSGFGLSYGDFDGWISGSHVGARLCFKNSSLAIDAGKKFIEIYATYYQTKK